MSMTVTILGCGSSGGVPRVGSGWGACDPANPKNRRRRCSILVERADEGGTTRVLVDTSPDLREQLIDAGVRWLDAVLYTHEHADHTHGIDDLRPLALTMRRRVPVHVNPETRAMLRARFDYCFSTPPGSEYPPIVDEHLLALDRPCHVEGRGGPVVAEPFRMIHGSIEAWGFRFGAIAYAPDVSHMPQESVEALRGLDVLILDALRYTPHPTHFSVQEALAFAAEVRPKRTILTNLHVDLDYETLRRQVPETVDVAFDGMRIQASPAADVE